MGSLRRFIDAQEPIYDQALAELKAGAKASHWMWFIFPQIRGLGLSETARYFAIADLAEARAYLNNPVLRMRLEECTDAVLEWAGRREADEILGPVDALKFRSSMTLFEAANGTPRFAQALTAFCNGQRDQRTLEILGSSV